MMKRNYFISPVWFSVTSMSYIWVEEGKENNQHDPGKKSIKWISSVCGDNNL